MTKDQEKHVASIMRAVNLRMHTKYELGAKEHGGNLWDLSKEALVDQAIDEAIDQLVYLYTIKQKIET